MKISLLALDIDGTILPMSTTVLSERTKNAIEEAIKQGIRVVICTGRGYEGAREITEQLPLQEPVITFAGAVLYDSGKQEVREEFFMEEEDVRLVLKVCEALDIHAQVYRGTGVLAAKETDFVKRNYVIERKLPFTCQPDLASGYLGEVPKMLIYMGPELDQEYYAVLRRRFPERIRMIHSAPGYIEIGRQEATKEKALERMAEKYRIPQSEVAAVGDDLIDLDMIRWAGVGCCMENGKRDVKRAADMILPPCEADGVAWFIEKYVLGKGESSQEES